MSAPPTTPVRAARTEPAPHGAGPTPGGRPSSPGSSRDGVGAVVLLGGGFREIRNWDGVGGCSGVLSLCFGGLVKVVGVKARGRFGDSACFWCRLAKITRSTHVASLILCRFSGNCVMSPCRRKRGADTIFGDISAILSRRLQLSNRPIRCAVRPVQRPEDNADQLV